MNGLPGPDDGYRDPPSNMDAEQQLLGAILVNNHAAEKVSGFLLPEHFSEPGHQRLYAAAMTLIGDGRKADPVTLNFFFKDDHAFSEIGGAQYLARLAGAAVTVINAEHYGRAIHETAMRRGMIQIAQELTAAAHGADIDVTPAQLIEQAQEGLYDLSSAGTTGKERSWGEVLRATLDQTAEAHAGNIPRITTGLDDLDRALNGGLGASQLVLLAGRPGMGKSSLAAQIAIAAALAGQEHDAMRGGPVAFFSLEMEAEEIAARQLAGDAQVDAANMAKGDITADDYSALERAGKAIWELPIHIRDTASLTVQQIRMQATALHRRHGISLVVVDHIGRIRRPGRDAHHEIGQIAQDLKNLAKDLKIPVLALNQLSRALENRDDKRPRLSDLRESGMLEEEADIVLFAFREEYYLERTMPPADTPDHARWVEKMDACRGLAEVIIAKHRSGRTRPVKLGWSGAYTRFHGQNDFPPPPRGTQTGMEL